MGRSTNRRMATRRSVGVTATSVLGAVMVCVLGVGSRVEARASELQALTATEGAATQVRGSASRIGAGGSGSPAPSAPFRPTTTSAPPATAPPITTPSTTTPSTGAEPTTTAATPTTAAPADAGRSAAAELDIGGGIPGAGPSGGSGPAGAPTSGTVVVTTPAALPVASEPGPTNEERGEEALASVGIDLRALVPGWTLRFLGTDPGYRGSTFPGDRRIEIYVREDLSNGQIAHTLVHEVGHALDVDRLNDEDRRRWLTQRGRAGSAWWAASGVSDYAVGSGDLAESLAFTITGGGEWNSRLGPPPSAADQALLRELLGVA